MVMMLSCCKHVSVKHTTFCGPEVCLWPDRTVKDCLRETWLVQEQHLPYEEALAKRQAHIGSGTRLDYKRPLHLVRAEGCHMYDADGVQYLDCVNNVAHVGHCNPKVK